MKLSGTCDATLPSPFRRTPSHLHRIIPKLFTSHTLLPPQRWPLILTMDLHEAQSTLVRVFNDANAQFHKMPGSAIILRYIKSSYQNDPVRSAIELFLFLFAVRYMLSPSYSQQKKVKLTEEVRLRWVAAEWGIGVRC